MGQRSIYSVVKNVSSLLPENVEVVTTDEFVKAARAAAPSAQSPKQRLLTDDDSTAAPPAVTISTTAERVTLANGYVEVGFNLRHPSVDVMRGDVSGRGDYGPNTAATRPDSQRLNRGGIVLERVWMQPDQDIWPITGESSN